jgi:hypothetical protein
MYDGFADLDLVAVLQVADGPVHGVWAGSHALAVDVGAVAAAAVSDPDVRRVDAEHAVVP